MLISPPRADLGLAYVNTLSWRGSPSPTESLNNLPGLVQWLQTTAGMENSARDIAAWPGTQRKKAGQVFAEAIALREVLYRLLSAVALGKAAKPRDVTRLQGALAEAPVRQRIARTATGYAWQVDGVPASAPHLLAPVLWSAGDLLVAGPRYRLRRCANDACLWLFLDQSKNATRRWCDMASCGNRAKAQRHYLKVKSASP